MRSPLLFIAAFAALACTSQSQPSEPPSGEGGSGGAPDSGEDDKAWLEADCPWPADGRAAVSLTYDDAMPSHLSTAVPALAQRDLKATFFLTTVSNDAPWKAVLEQGHELAAHTPSHPCPKSYGTPGTPLEDFTLQSFALELDKDVEQLKRLGAPAPYTFAYPCGVTWVGEDQDSYIPLVEERFFAARLAGPGNTSADVDLYRVPSTFDLKTAEQLIAAVDKAVASKQWLVLGFHGVGGDWLITDTDAHAALLDNLQARSDVWIAPFGEIAACVQKAQTP